MAYNYTMIDFMKNLIANVLFFVMIAVGYMAISYFVIASVWGLLTFGPELISKAF